MTPFLNWAGGKRWLVAKHAELLWADASRLIEPFLGSGAVYFHLQPKAAILADLNRELILTYSALRDDYQTVLRHLRSHHRRHDRDHYYSVRTSRPPTNAARAAKFIYLNRTCFNGLYRVNARGAFNVPKGTKDAVLYPTDDFERLSHILQGAELLACDFEDTIAQAGVGDLVYADPPYTVKHNSNNFLKYNERIFSWEDQKRLAVSLAEAAARGAHVLVSNADHASVRELYSASCWSHITLWRHSRLASSSQHRGRTTEVVISNYLSGSGEYEDPRW